MEPASRQPAVQRSVDECGEILRVEHLARHRNRCGSGHEIRGRKLALGVTANSREDILAILLEPAVPRRIGIET
jgi:hypothetical protein